MPSGRSSFYLSLGLIVLFWTLQGCRPRSVVIAFNEDRANVTVNEFYDYASGIYHTDSTYQNVPLDSLSQFTLNCNYATYHFTDSANTIRVTYASKEDFSNDTCYASPPQLTLRFAQPVTQATGTTEKLRHTLDRKEFLLPVKLKYFNENPAEFTFSTDHSLEPNYRHRIGLKYLGFVIDPLPGFGRGWTVGEAGDLINDGLFLNFGLAFILNDFRLLMRLAHLELEPSNALKPDPLFEFLSSSNLEFGLGYEVLDKQFFTVTPSVFGGRKKFRFSTSEREIENVETDHFYTYGAGLTIDFKIQQLLRNAAQREAKKGEHIYLEFDGGWYPELFEKSFGLSGSLTYFTIGISGYLGGARELRKVKIK